MFSFCGQNCGDKISKGKNLAIQKHKKAQTACKNEALSNTAINDVNFESNVK
jgi:hypothetical protein